MTQAEQRDGDEGKSDFISHLIELRGRFLRMLFAVTLVFLCLFPFADELYSLVAQPLLKYLPEGASMIAIDVASPFLIPFKMVMLLSVVLTVPYLLYQLWAFIAPGLYRQERRFVFPLLVSSTLLFYLGIAFAYYVVFPLVFKFIIGVAPAGVTVMTDISRYLDFVITIFIAFGLAFEIPIATFIMVAVGLTTPAKLASIRAYVIVAAFVLGMLLTPPDIISQILLALPMWVLFELGIIFSKIFLQKKVDAENDVANESE